MRVRLGGMGWGDASVRPYMVGVVLDTLPCAIPYEDGGVYPQNGCRSLAREALTRSQWLALEPADPQPHHPQPHPYTHPHRNANLSTG